MYGELRTSQMGQGINLLMAEAGWRRSSTPPKTHELYRPLGDVAGLPIGSHWINGASAAVNDRIETVVIDVPALDGWPTNKLGEVVWEPGERSVYPLTGVRAAPTWRIRTGDQTYFVPAVELIRAVFGPTTDFLRLAIEGGVELWPTDRRMIFDINASGRDPSDPEVIRIKAHRTLHRREAETIARILTNDRMRTAFMQIFASKQNALRDRHPLFPTTIFPFDEPTQWTVDTAWTRVTSENPNREPSRRRLITRIRSIKAPLLPFQKITVEVPGAAGELEEGEKRRFVSVKSADTVQEQLRIDPQRAPASNLTTTALNGGHTSHESGFELEHIVTDATGRQSTVVIEDEDDEHVEMGSTYWPAGRKGAVGVSFQSSVVDFDDEPRAADSLLTATRNALERIAGKRNWPCGVISPPFGCGADPMDGLYRYPPDARGRPLTWSIVRRGGRLRRALVMRVATEGGNVYVIDAERQEATEGHALGLLFTPLHRELTYPAIETILATNAAERGVWRQATGEYPTVKLRRNGTWFNDLSAYGVYLVGAISALNEGRRPAEADD
ncbi:hypothetical protein D3C73_32960 [compost metagenome]